MKFRNALKVVALATLLVVPFNADAVEERISSVNNAPSAPVLGASCPNGQTILLNQQPNQVNGIFSDADCGACGTGMQAVAGDFILAADATIGQLVFWGGYFPTDMIPSPADAFTVIFHSDGAGVPGGDLATETVVPTTATQTGVILFGVNEVEYVLDLTPVTLTAGTYWVEIFTNSVGNADSFFWEVGNLDVTNGRDGTAFATVVPGSAWTATAAQDFSMMLCAAAPVGPMENIVDVPTLDTLGLTVLVALLALVGFVVMARRRRNV